MLVGGPEAEEKKRGCRSPTRTAQDRDGPELTVNLELDLAGVRLDGDRSLALRHRAGWRRPSPGKAECPIDCSCRWVAVR